MSSELGMRRPSLGRLGIWKYQHRRAKFNPETAGDDLLRVMARAGDTPDFSALEARVRETQNEVRRVFNTLIGGR